MHVRCTGSHKMTYAICYDYFVLASTRISARRKREYCVIWLRVRCRRPRGAAVRQEIIAVLGA